MRCELALATVFLVSCSAAPAVEVNATGPGETLVTITPAQVSSTSELVPPGSRTLYGFTANNYAQGPIALTSCESNLSFDASGSSVAVTTIGVVNLSPDRVDNIGVTYSLVAYSALGADDEALSGGISAEIPTLGPFAFRRITQRIANPVSDHPVLDGVACGIADIDGMSGNDVHYPHATDFGRDIAL